SRRQKAAAMFGFETAKSAHTGSFAGESFSKNAFGVLKDHVPGQGKLEFEKGLDSATPQLAYGCSSQQGFRCGLFFFQRRSGFALNAVVFPYFVLGLQNVLIRD